MKRIIRSMLVPFAVLLVAACTQGTPPVPGPAPVNTQPAAATVPSGPTSAPPPGQATPAATASTPSGGAPGNVAAIVNGQTISMAEYQKEIARARAFFIDQGLIDPNTTEGKERLDQINRQVLEQELISQVLMDQAAARMGIKVSDAEVQASIDSVIKELGGKEAFDQGLAARGMTYDEFVKEQRDQLVANALRDQLTADVPRKAEQIHARHILVNTAEEAQKVLARLKGGEDFAKVAKEVSQDTSSAENGGDLGWFPRGTMVPEFEEVAFKLQANQLSDPVQSPFGYHVIQLLEKDPAREMDEDLWQSIRQQKFIEWLDNERAKANVQLFIGQ